MKGKKRTKQVYELVNGRRRVYIGTTNDPKRREAEHRNSGKQFTKMRLVSGKRIPSNAKKLESDMLKTHRKNHGGKNPRYNKDNDG